MEKLFVSVPMRGRSDEDIDKSIKKLAEAASIIFGKDFEIVHNHVDIDVPDDVEPSSYMVSKAIEKLSKCDYFVGIWNSYGYDGCNIEHQVWTSYKKIENCLRLEKDLICPDLKGKEIHDTCEF